MTVAVTLGRVISRTSLAAAWLSSRVTPHLLRPLPNAAASFWPDSTCPAGNAPAPGSRINRKPTGKNTPGVATTSQAGLKGLTARLSACLHPGAVPQELLRGAGVLRADGEGSNPLCEYPTPHPQGKYGRHSRPSNGLAVLKPTFPKPKEKVGRAGVHNQYSTRSLRMSCNEHPAWMAVVEDHGSDRAVSGTSPLQLSLYDI